MRSLFKQKSHEPENLHRSCLKCIIYFLFPEKYANFDIQPDFPNAFVSCLMLYKENVNAQYCVITGQMSTSKQNSKNTTEKELKTFSSSIF